MKVDGKCLCGAVSYEAEVDTSKIVICHCTDCQTNSGTAYGVVAVVVDGTFKLLTGELRTFVKVADSGNRREQAFCGECGSPLWATSVGDGPKVHGLRVGTLAERDRLAPRRQVWLRSALAWVTGIGRLPGVDGQP